MSSGSFRRIHSPLLRQNEAFGDLNHHPGGPPGPWGQVAIHGCLEMATGGEQELMAGEVNGEDSE